MGHREKGLQPWIIAGDPESYKLPEALREFTDKFYHATEPPKPWSRDNPVFLPQSLYDRAKAAGYDMTIFAVQQPIPISKDAPIFAYAPGSLTRRGNPR